MRFRLGLAVLLGAVTASAAAGQSSAPPADPGGIGGVWKLTNVRSTIKFTARERVIKTVEGEDPPLRPAARAVLDKRLAGTDAGVLFADTLSECLPGGVPKTESYSIFPIQIIPQRDQVTILYEELHHFRVILLNQPHADDPDPSYDGDAIGHWEGDTLVVDTIGFNDKTTLDAAGTPHSEALHVIQRYRRIDPHTLEMTALIDDPKTFTKPWSTRTLFLAEPPGAKIDEYVCDNNRNAAGPASTAQGFSVTQIRK